MNGFDMETLNESGYAPSEEVFRRLADNAAEVLYSMTFAGSVRMKFINSKAEELTGYAVEQILDDNPNWMDIVHNADRQRLMEHFNQCKNNAKPCELEYRLVAKNGAVREVLDRTQPIFNTRGEVMGIDGLILDVTERNRAQRELDRTQMILNIGKLSAGIAHEINTPIQFIGDNMRFLSDSFEHVIELLGVYKQIAESTAENDLSGECKNAAVEKIRAAEEQADLDFLTEEIPRAIEQSLDGIKRVLTIVSAMRDFSHIDERRMAPADLNKALKSTIVLLRNEIKYVADLNIELDENLPMVYCCVDDMNQVFLNILINAVHSITEAARDKGLITVKSRQIGKDVLFSISDTGTGIRPRIQNKIFDPFFTTRQAGKGTGQGLSLARSIVVEKHAGSLDFETQIGVGTTFTVRLPIEQNGQKRNG
ncbi:MAG TPA: PAS domain-containing protein [Planctomycetes bacterium]|nr:PAS domain-containing protein [Planctomycetota bacterium]